MTPFYDMRTKKFNHDYTHKGGGECVHCGIGFAHFHPKGSRLKDFLPEPAKTKILCTCRDFTDEKDCEHVRTPMPTKEQIEALEHTDACQCSCHDNVLNKPYEHDTVCCDKMNGEVEWETIFSRFYDKNETGGSSRWLVSPDTVKNFIRGLLKEL